MEPSTEKQPGVFRRSWTLMRSSWRVLKLDKELTALPVLSAIASILLLATTIILLMVVAYTVTPGPEGNGATSWTAESDGFSTIAILVPFYILGAFVVNFFAAALIYGALQRFQGADPTVKGSLKAAARKWRPLLFFSIISGIVAIILDLIREWASRLPLGGAIVGYLFAFLGNLAWAAATFFALPHIMTSEKELSPKQVINSSIKTLRGVWGESAVTYGGLSVISLLLTILLVGGFIGIGAAAYSAHLGAAVLFGVGGLGAVSLLALIIILTTLESIVKAAVFYYAVTGQAPVEFDKQLLRAAMTPKKARGIFGGQPKGGTWAS